MCIRMLVITTLFLSCCGSRWAHAETLYKVPPASIVALVDAPAPPLTEMDPQGRRLLQVEIEPNPPLALLARPFQSLAGVRVDLALHARRRIRRNRSLRFVDIADGRSTRVELPAGASFSTPLWSPDGSRVAFGIDAADGVELWIADAATGTPRRIPGVQVNDILGSPIRWVRGGAALLVSTVPADLGPQPEPPAVPPGPVVQESAGKRSRMFTFQDLLENEFDAALFEHVASSQLVMIDVETGKTVPFAGPGLYVDAAASPDGRFVLVTRLQRPFSYRVPFGYFSRTVDVLDAEGAHVYTVATLPVSDEVPVQGVPEGPREVEWQPLHDATLVWVEALDGGDPTRKVPHRDRLLTLTAPFTNPAAEVMRLQHRLRALAFGARRDEVWITEFERERRWRTTYAVHLRKPQAKRVLFDLSVNDAYNDPGQPLTRTLPDGSRVLRQDGDTVYLSGRGATPDGNRPFLDAFDVRAAKSKRLFSSAPDAVESCIGFAGGTRAAILVRRESPQEPPDYYVVPLAGGERRRLTTFPHPYPQMAGVEKRLLKYRRADGVPLSGTLYLPPDRASGTRLPCLVWAYPLEYSDAATAGQVRSAPNGFTLYRGASPLFFVTQGYAVLMDATMPVVGDPETMNETFVEQIVAAAQAAVHVLDSLGVVDPRRIVVSGHSYGAFMTANLLAHCDLFAAGIARSGAYNRTLTPFGFQSERRSFWEAPDVYMRVSPFAYADHINEPLLLIHGQADDNPGTYTVQSERMFEALQANGATARLVLLPYESHGYAARESILHTLAEMLEWSDQAVQRLGEGDAPAAAH